MTTHDARPHPDDALVDLATGEVVSDAVHAHVAACPRCQEELVAMGAVAELVRMPAPELVQPPGEVWAAVLAEIDGGAVSDPTEAPGGSGTGAREVEVTPTGAVVHDLEARRRRRVSPWWLVAAAAAGLVVGGAGVAVVDRPAPGPRTVVLARASLDTLDTERALGQASAVEVGRQLDLDVSTPGLDPGRGYLEVWLINKDLKRMVSIGVLRPGEGTQRFPIDRALIDRGYVIVDISREGYDAHPEHSGNSLVRGTLQV